VLLEPQGHTGFHVLWRVGHLQDRDGDRPLLPVHVIAEGFAGGLPVVFHRQIADLLQVPGKSSALPTAK
jgi:hypothetical protein